MQLKNNLESNLQFFFRKNHEVDVVHIPGGSTVEIDDAIWNQLISSTTRVEQKRRIETEIEGDASVSIDKQKAVIVDYVGTGEYKTINIVASHIKAGDIKVVERPKVGMADIDSILKENGIDISKMPDDAKLAVYEKLVG